MTNAQTDRPRPRPRPTVGAAPLAGAVAGAVGGAVTHAPGALGNVAHVAGNLGHVAGAVPGLGAVEHKIEQTGKELAADNLVTDMAKAGLSNPADIAGFSGLARYGASAVWKAIGGA